MKNDYEIIQELKKRNEVTYELVLAEDTNIITIPAKYLSENYRIEIEGKITQDNYFCSLKAYNGGCYSGIISNEGSGVVRYAYNNHWGCIIAAIKKIAYINMVLNIHYNPLNNGLCYECTYAAYGSEDNIPVNGVGGGSQRATTSSYNLQLGLSLASGSKIRVIKQP